MLNHTTDYYDGVTIDEACLPESVDGFKTAIQSSLKEWKASGKKGVWLKVSDEAVQGACQREVPPLSPLRALAGLQRSSVGWDLSCPGVEKKDYPWQHQGLGSP